MSRVIRGKSLEYVEFKSKMKHQKINAGQLMRNNAKVETLTKIDAQKIEGIEDNQTLKELISNSNFSNEKCRWSEVLFEKQQIALIYQTMNGEDKLIYALPTGEIKWQFGDIVDIRVNSGILDSNGKQVFWRYYKDDNGILKMDVEILDGYEYKINGETQILINQKYLPIWLIRDNPSGRNVWDNEDVKSTLKEIDILSNELGLEWEKVKTMFNFNQIFSQGQTKEDIQEKMFNGESMFGGHNRSERLGVALEALSVGGQSSILLMQQINYLKDLIFQHTFSSREIDTSATNKVNAQIVKSDRASFEYNNARREQRQRDYQMFYDRVLKSRVLGLTDRKIKIALNDFDNNIREIEARQMVDNNYVKSQTNYQVSNAKLNEAKIIDLGKKEVKENIV